MYEQEKALTNASDAVVAMNIKLENFIFKDL